MKEYFLPFEEHNDFGFGIMADNYRDSAKILAENKEKDKYWYSSFPINYLRRHSIELYIKSIITLISRKLEIIPEDTSNVDEVHFRLPNGKWKNLKNTHSLDLMYKYLVQLTNDNYDSLMSIHEGNWNFPDNLIDKINRISGYDNASDYFRYPMSKDTEKDKKKNVFQQIEVNEIEIHMKDETGKIFMVYEDDVGNITRAYNNVAKDMFGELLVEILEVVACYQAQARYTLFPGY